MNGQMIVLSVSMADKPALTDFMQDSPANCLPVWLADWLTDRPTDWLCDWPTIWLWLTVLLTHWLTDWPTDWMTDVLMDSLIDWTKKWTVQKEEKKLLEPITTDCLNYLQISQLVGQSVIHWNRSLG